MIKMTEITYEFVKQPSLDGLNEPIMLSDETMQIRYHNVLDRMKEEQLDTLVIYGDLEHGNNFEYLCGFLPRFEEALLVIHQQGENFMIMGNENLNKVEHARIDAKPLHAPYFSLPNQPMNDKETLREILEKAHIEREKKIGIVGWKLFTNTPENNKTLFDVPYYIVDEIMKIADGMEFVSNATYIFIGEHGVRCTNTINELEHYEFGASLASDRMLKTMNLMEEHVSEMTLGNELNAFGQKNSVVTIAAAGKRFEKANIYPTQNTVKIGDPISLTVGYKGGLSSRSGYAVHDVKELPQAVQDYLDIIVKPYYRAVVSWLENVQCGCKGDEVYQMIEGVLPKDKYHWDLCPGHLTADEEWLSSPIYAGSNEILKSGMIFQLDIIPSIKGYAGTSAESTVALADEALRRKLEKEAPKLWSRIVKRRAYLTEELHIHLHEDILPMCSTVAYLRPYLLNKEKAMMLIK